MLVHVPCDSVRGEGIKACKDDEMLIGEDISPALVEAIEQSRASIVILSPNYVDSTWCLGELVKILECKEHIILPICYGVDPSETNKKRGTYYTYTFARHELKHGMEFVQNWRWAAEAVADYAGYDAHDVR